MARSAGSARLNGEGQGLCGNGRMGCRKAVHDEFAGMSDAELSWNDRLHDEVLAKMGESADVRGLRCGATSSGS